jgi:hypothetical protein
LTGTAAIIGGGALIGAGVGGLYSGITGDGDILNSMLTGGLIGGAGAFGLNAMGVGAAAPTVTPTAALANAPISSAAVPTANVITPTAAQTVAATGANTTTGAALANASADPIMAAANLSGMTEAQIAAANVPAKAAGLTGGEMLGYGLAGTTAMQLLGGKGKGAQGPAADPGMIRPFEFSSTPKEATGNYPAPYASASYDASGNPIMDTRERNYFDQDFVAMTPYSAKAGTVNPNLEPVTMAARGGLMFDDESGMDEARGLMQGNLQKGLFGQGYAHGGPVKHMFGGGSVMSRALAKIFNRDQDMDMQKYQYDPATQQYNNLESTDTLSGLAGLFSRLNLDKKTNASNFSFDPQEQKYKEMAEGGSVEEEAELRRTVMNNLQKLAPEQLQDVMGYMNPADKEKQFLSKHMPGYAESMRPSISGMVENAQYGDRMAQSFGANPKAFNFQPRVQDLQNYGGIASIGQQIDPNTRMNMVADLQRSPYDRSPLDSVRRVGAGVDRRMGNDANLSAYYEQDPQGRNKSGGVRYTQKFNMGGAADLGDYSDGGRLLKGPGDGVSDDIPATIAGKQPARLADGEFVIPARIVSEIGNGSTDAGAKRLYAMMDRIQDGRKKTIGKKNVAKDTKAKKHLLA